jgi:NAD(P)-dependent dehydrogenase (short-subunit alcohol dehydrogenase family)
MITIDLSGKVALVTGGSRGLGKAMSLGLARAGADVIVASRKLENCERVCEEIRALGCRALPVSVHVGHMDRLDTLINTTLAEMGKVDILINNAVLNPTMDGLSDLTPELFDKMYQVNLKGPWYLASRLAPRMAETGGGNIINIISVGGLKPSAFTGPYAALKAALNAMTRVMAAEWAEHGIRVNAIAPGSYRSDLFNSTARAFPGFEEGAKSACLQKRIADTEEILGPVLYLASDMGSYTTGTTIVADGGFLVL